MGLIVQKFGGSSVRDRERLLRAMRIVRRTWEQGDDVVVVLSAQGDTTDALPSLAAIRAAVSALETAGITVLGLEEGEQRVTLLVKRADEDTALCAVHDTLVPR